MVEDAADRLGIRKRRESRHWAAFFMGLVLGAVAGAVVAMLTTPKPGREMRDELTEKAREAAERARASAGGASDWVPLFQRNEANGQATRSEAVEAEAPSELAPEGGEGDVAT
jgi:gas vesicle protein